MARVEIGAQEFGTIIRNGQPVPNATVQIATLAGPAATHWSAVTGGSSSTANLSTDLDGVVGLGGAPRFIEEDTYNVTALGTTRREEAVSGQSVSALNTNALLKTLADAKGDLLVGTAADTIARLAIGQDGNALVADSSQPSGVKWARAADPWMPGGALADNGLRFTSNTNETLTSGTLFLAGGMVLPTGVAINALTFLSGSTGQTTPTNQWACLVDLSLNVLAKSADQTTSVWGALSLRTFTLTAAYTPTADTPVYAGVVVVAATPNNLRGTPDSGGLIGATPKLAGNSTTGLTNPASLGATAAAISSTPGATPYVYAT